MTHEGEDVAWQRSERNPWMKLKGNSRMIVKTQNRGQSVHFGDFQKTFKCIQEYEINKIPGASEQKLNIDFENWPRV